MAIKRRTAIIGGAVVLTATTGGAALLFRRQRPPLPEMSGEADLSEGAKELARLLYARMEGVRIEGSAYVAFVRDHQLHQGKIRGRKKASGAIVTKFLLSTDFFQNGAKEQRLTRYRGYYDPYVSVCGNPFTREDQA